MVQIAMITVPDESVAKNIARTLVEERLAACVNIVGGVTSVFRWQGNILEETELLLLAKTTRTKFADLQRRVIQLHPYDVPEIVSLDVPSGYDHYLAWVKNSVN